jgi:hypothetical protein
MSGREKTIEHEWILDWEIERTECEEQDGECEIGYEESDGDEAQPHGELNDANFGSGLDELEGSEFHGL